MTTREEKKLLVDIIESINSIDEHLEGKRIIEDYLLNKTKRRAVEREIEIIGEAMSKLLKINPKISISYSRLVVDLRNKVIHAYDTVDDILIWKIVNKDIPLLLTEAKSLLNED
ncbi:MAG TPA: hypothetical protein DCM02_01300 [Flavobacterium sp.]|nr:hypothetical protein [Flavobacterium sp.]HAT75624.1 hypothetical protein [Flavobacterium sp.]HAT81011.1 hypothetical protein [Flavobacterium sp.]